MKNVNDYNNLLNEGKKVRPEEIEDYFTNTNSGKMLDKIFKGKFDEEKFRNYLGDILDRTKRIESVIKIWSGYFGLNPKDYTSGEFIENIMFLDDITVAAKEAYETFVNEYVNEASEDFAGWVAIYNNNRIEIDKSEADGIYQAKQIAIKKLKVPKSKVGLLSIAPGYNESMHEGKNDYSARFGKTDITIKNGHKLTDEDSLYDMYEKIGKVIKDSGLDLGSVIIKESQSVNEGEITDYVTALGTVVAQVMADHPKLGKYHEMKGKRGFIKLQQLKDLPEKELIALANSL